MTARIELIPSPFDRLDPIGRAVRWWTTQLTQLVGTPARKATAAENVEQNGRLSGRTTITLADTDVFVAKLTAPKGPTEAHRRVLELRLTDLAPVDPERLVIAATALGQNSDGSVTYALAMARRERLDLLERLARRKGASRVRFEPQDMSALELRSPATMRAERRGLLVDAGLIGALMVSAVFAVLSWTARVENETAALMEQERGLRRSAIAAESLRRQGELARDFISRGVLDRRAGAALQTLADINEATPSGAWWTSIRWSPTETVVSAQALDAASAIEAISTSARAWSVELAGAISSGAPTSAQTFELRIRPRGSGARP